ncbi:MAG: glycosyl hydrolase family 18 protein [Deltaproteobacteria bacterium]
MLVSILISLFLTIPYDKIDISYTRDDTTALVIKADIIDCKNTPPIVKGDQVLLPIDIVKKYFDPNLFFDDKMDRVVITNKDNVLKMKPDSNIIYVNNKPFKSIISPTVVKGKLYLPINFLKNIYGISINVNSNYNIVAIDYKQEIHTEGRVMQLLPPVRKNKFASSPIIKVVKLNDTLEVFDAYKDWYKVRTKEGLVGFIGKSNLQLITIVSSEPKNKTYALKDIRTPKISLAWDQMLNVNNVNKIDGLQIISPFWFYVSDENGTVNSKASDESMKAYVKKAHQEGYKVWALFSNSFSPVISSSILNDGTLKDKVINQIVSYANTYALDGINIDFENMYNKDKDMFTQFVKELAPILRAKGKIISVDVGAPSGYANIWGCCDAKALSQVVDYVALMTYDQHWSNCPYSGSVAQYSWVEDKLQAALEEVPSSKLLLGIPFYARGWREEADSSGAIKVTQYKVFSMNGAVNEVKTNNAKVRWDDESGQLYAEYNKDNAVHKIWLENEDSINLKSSLVQKYNLAGVAIWEKSYAKPEVWGVLKKNLQQEKSYATWIKNNKALYAKIKELYLCKQ